MSSYFIDDAGIVHLKRASDLEAYRIDKGILKEEFNEPVILEDTIDTCNQLFADYTLFNQPVIIPDTVKDCYKMFEECYSLNSPVVIGKSVQNCEYMFSGCINLNQEIIIPDSVISCKFMLRRCSALNSNVVIGNNVKYCNNMFASCFAFNKSVVIPASVSSCYSMFSYCKSLNSPIIMNSCDVKRNCVGMFYNCVNFNQQLFIPDGVTDVSNLFTSTSSYKRMLRSSDNYGYKHTIVFPSSVNICRILNDDMLFKPRIFIGRSASIAFIDTCNFIKLRTEHLFIIIDKNNTTFEFNSMLDDIENSVMSNEDNVKALLVEIFDALIPIATQKGDGEFIASWLDYKHQHNLYDDNPLAYLTLDDNPNTTIDTDTDDDTSGGFDITHLFD